MAKHMTEQNTIMNAFAMICSNLVKNAAKKTDQKIEKIEDKTIEHEHRLRLLKKCLTNLNRRNGTTTLW